MTTNRIVMNPSLTGRPLVVSRPGYDALTASGTDEVAFDAAWIAMNQILYEGVASANSGVYVDEQRGNDIGGRYYLLASFASPGFVPLPLVFIGGTSRMVTTSRFLVARHNAIYIGQPTLSDTGTIQGDGVPSGTYHYIITNIAIDE